MAPKQGQQIVDLVAAARLEEAFELPEGWTGRDLIGAHLRLAARFRAEPEVIKALNEAKRLLKEEDDLERGARLLRMGKKEEAIPYLRRAAEEKDSALACHLLGASLVQLERRDEALPHLQKAVQLRGEATDHHWLGSTLVQLGRNDEALPCLRKAVELRGEDIDHQWLWKAMGGKVLRMPVRIPQTVPPKAEPNAEEEIREGMRLHRAGKLSAALPHFARAVAIRGDGLDHHWRGSTLAQLGRREAALPHLQKAVELRGQPIDQYWLGSTLAQLGRHEEALPYLRKAVELRGEGIDHYWLGCTLVQLQRREEALPYLRKAVELKGEVVDYHSLGSTLAELQRHEEALPYLRKAVELRGWGSDHRCLGGALAEIGRYKEALSHLRKAADLLGEAVDRRRLQECEALLAERVILLDHAHGEHVNLFAKLVKHLSSRCEVKHLKRRPVTLESLCGSRALMLISPIKQWEEGELAAVHEYVRRGGNLVVLTHARRKPERLNSLLEPYGLSVGKTEVRDRTLSGKSLHSDVFDGLGDLSAGPVYWEPNATLATNGRAPILLRFRDAPIVALVEVGTGAGRGAVLVQSCLTIFGNRQLDNPNNRAYLDRLLDYLLTEDRVYQAIGPGKASDLLGEAVSRQRLQDCEGLPAEGATTQIVLDQTHGEQLNIFTRLVKELADAHKVRRLTRGPLTLESLGTSAVLMLISPIKHWEKNEIAAVQEYVRRGGSLVVLTYARRKPERLNSLLEPYELSVDGTEVRDRTFGRGDLRSEVFDGLGDLSAGPVYWERNAMITTDDKAEILLRFKNMPLVALAGAGPESGRGSVLVLSCLTIFGNRQMGNPNNRAFLHRLFDYVLTRNSPRQLEGPGS